MIKVSKIDDQTFEVTVKDGGTTTHRVTVSDDYYMKLSGGKVTPETLLEKSFEFLLERESNTSIFSSFDLPTITRYFPEYEQEIRKRLT